MEETGNSIHLRGHVCQSLQFGHELFGEQFYVTTLKVPRLSGAEDYLPITLSERLLMDAPISTGSLIALEAQSICLHGDSPAALAIARRLRAVFEAAGIALTAGG